MGGEEQALVATEEACRVYVGNLLPKAKERHLTSKFACFGTIHSVWIARRPPGFAFVRFAAPDAAQRAVEACREDGAMEILGKAVRVQMAGDKDRKYHEQTESRSAAKEGDAAAGERRKCSARRRGRLEDSRERSRSRNSRLGERERRRDRRSRSSSRGAYRRSRHRSEMRTRNSSRSRSRRRHVGRTDSRSRSRGSSRDRDSARRRRRSSRSSSRGRR